MPTQPASDDAAEAGNERDWAVNVRAVVRLTQVDPDAADWDFDGWEVYDNEKGDDDAVSIVRCDQLVRVRASTQDEAVERAKVDATCIAIPPGYEAEIDLWVDEDIDVDPGYADTSSPSP